MKPYLRKLRAPTVLLLLATSMSGCQHQNTLVAPSPDVNGGADLLVAAEDGTVKHKEVDFNSLLLDSPGKTVVVDFWANWCGPCQMLSPELEQLASEHEDHIRVVKVDVDAEPGLAAHFQVASIPDIRIFKDGQPVGGTLGFQTADKIFLLTQN